LFDLKKFHSSTDRNARYKLLSNIELFVEHLADKVVNEQVYPQIENGFIDREPVIREKTVIAVIHLAPSLNFSNLVGTRFFVLFFVAKPSQNQLSHRRKSISDRCGI
jgi:hypothetical protein